jgi:hypothetical protein
MATRAAKVVKDEAAAAQADDAISTDSGKTKKATDKTTGAATAKPSAKKKAAPVVHAAPRMRPRGNPKSQPFFVKRTPLNSYHAQQVYGRAYEVYANSIFLLSVVLRAIETNEAASEVEAIIDDMMDKSFEDIEREIARADKSAEANGVQFGSVGYTDPQVFEVKITSPRAVRYLAIISEFDRLIGKLDTLWMAGVIDENNHKRTAYEWKQRVLRISGKVRHMTARAMSAAQRKEEAGILDRDTEAIGGPVLPTESEYAEAALDSVAATE